MTAAVTTVGVDAFRAGLAGCGVETSVRSGVVVFAVVAATRSGVITIETGVAVAELQAWPAVPPHWIHLPASVQFAHTNINAQETLPGWARHSRDIVGWGNAQEPGQAWLAHVRGVMLEAT
jgi:hypothetical protein